MIIVIRLPVVDTTAVVGSINEQINMSQLKPFLREISIKFNFNRNKPASWLLFVKRICGGINETA